MTTQATNNIITHFKDIELSILAGYCNRTWNGIDFKWVATPLKRGGTLKRKKVYGIIKYSYLGQDMTREEALAEASKPYSLRQALIEATTSIECNMCGLTLVGKDALDPFTSISFDRDTGYVYRKKQWGLVFWKMKENNEPLTLNICPACLQRIANGEFRE